MKIPLKLLSALALTLIAFGSAALARSPDLAEAWNAPAVAWQDLRSGIKQATQEKKQVIMVFHASWCSSCKRYREVFKDPAVVEAARNFVMILVDADADKEANGAFAPDGTYVPRTLFMDWEGNIRPDIHGATDPNYPHTIDANGPGELLALMLKAMATAPRSEPAPSVPQKDAALTTP